MKKILIISYFFPPANFVGGQRAAAWAKYLTNYGYYPTIITRNWNEGQKELTDKLEDNSFKHEIYDTYEIYRLPYKRTQRDKLNDYPNSKIATFFRKTLSYLELVFQNFFFRAIPYANFYDLAKKLILNDKKYEYLIVSGRPFQLFSIASKLKKTTGIKWFADYRDEWNSFQNNHNISLPLKFIYYLETKSERKWTKNALGFFTVSEFWKENISKFISKKGYVVMNGFDKTINHQTAETTKDFTKLEIAYIGTLYSYQPIEVFIESIQKIIIDYKDKITIKINFIGLSIMPDQEQRIKILIKDFEQYFFIYDRMSKDELKQFYENADFLLATSFNNIQGWYPVKIFEYAASGKPIFLCPSDNDVLNKFLIETNTGIVVNSKEESYNFLQNVIEQKLKENQISFRIESSILQKYSREHQTGKLTEVLNMF